MKEAKEKIPSIVLNIYIEYNEKDDDNLGGFSDLNLNLDDTRRDISISCKFHIVEGEKFLGKINELCNEEDSCIVNLVEQIYSEYYKKEYFAFDKKRSEVEAKPIHPKQIENAFILNLICAQRDLDDQSYDKKGRIAKCMNNFLDMSILHEDNIENLTEKLNNLAIKIEQEDHPLIYGPIVWS